ncbi:hypothetical protein ABFS82_12G017400 [Erythranthe guttata]|uniref:protein RER1C-like n=1 Tax=Erythranthe guttata TaxID=4155 RepID=UPI00064DFAC7|nr:PREDICTED: protein RER1C-like [Erythranthe guttata]|eukprot:XP_012840807.1 PREDICTED: protein RER1C-like [Erythranthe guttata]
MEPPAGGSTSTTNIPANAITPSSAEDAPPPTATAAHRISATSRRFHNLLDRTTPYVLYRWIALLCIALTYVVRIYLVRGFCMITFFLGVYLLVLFVLFISPREAPELSDAPTLPVRSSDEFRPFVRRLPEFQFWLATTTALCIATLLTCFRIFNAPVLWPILLVYWIFLCTLTLRKQIQRMIKYNYVPFTFGKKRYDRNRESSGEVRGRESLLP